MQEPLTADDVIRRYALEPLKGEGGFFRRTWFRPAAEGDAPEASCIMYLITPESFSALHRLRYDEMFHFYLGDPCRTVMIAPDGGISDVLLGPDIVSGMQVQHLVPGGYWQATALAEGGDWALLGTTMSPGFHESGFELATPDVLRHLACEQRRMMDDLIAKPDHSRAMIKRDV